MFDLPFVPVGSLQNNGKSVIPLELASRDR